MSFTGRLLWGESSIAMKIRLLKEYGGLDEEVGGGLEGCESSIWGSGLILSRGCSGSRSLL